MKNQPKKMEWKQLIVFALIIAVSISMIGAFAFSSGTTSIYPGNLTTDDIYTSTINATKWYSGASNVTDLMNYPQSEASYIIFNVGATTYVKNGTSGLIVNSSASAATAINYALTYGSVFVMAGTYSITSSILMQNNTNLLGEGQRTIFKQGNDANLQAVILIDGVQNCTVGYLNVDGNKTGQTNTTSTINFGIQVANASKNIIIENCIVHDSKQLNICVFTGTSTVYAQNILIQNNICFGGRDGIAVDYYCCDINIINNICYNNSGFGIGAAFNVTRTNYINNIVYDNPINVYVGSNCSEFMINGNHIWNATIGIAPKEVSIDAGAHDITIENNIIVGLTNTSSRGITLGWGAGAAIAVYNILITGNMITSQGNALDVDTVSYNIQINDNQISSNQIGASVVNAKRVQINDNKFKPFSSATYAIYEASPSDYNTFTDNTVKGLGFALLIYKTGSGSYVFNNYGYVTENTGSLTNTTATTFVIAHGLASTPTFFSCSFNDTGVTNYVWTANATHTTVTVAGALGASVTCYWNGIYKP